MGVHVRVHGVEEGLNIGRSFANLREIIKYFNFHRFSSFNTYGRAKDVDLSIKTAVDGRLESDFCCSSNSCWS